MMRAMFLGFVHYEHHKHIHIIAKLRLRCCFKTYDVVLLCGMSHRCCIEPLVLTQLKRLAGHLLHGPPISQAALLHELAGHLLDPQGQAGDRIEALLDARHQLAHNNTP